MFNKVSFKKRYFTEWSEKMAYILGLFVADGCIYIDNEKRYKSFICSKDLDMLEFVKNEIKPEGNINHSKDGTSRIWFINKEFVMDLMSMGVLPRKTYDPMLPEIPKEYRKYFLLGYFDGDGSVWININNKVLSTSFTCYSKQFLQKIGDILHDEIGIIPKIYKDNRENSNTNNMIFSTKESLGLYHYFYDNNKNFYLNRKYNKFNEWLDNYKKDRNYGICKCKICENDFVKFHDQSNKCWSCRRNNHDIVRS